jgi:hypothetical protein
MQRTTINKVDYFLDNYYHNALHKPRLIGTDHFMPSIIKKNAVNTRGRAEKLTERGRD